MQTDPVSDMLTRIRNAARARHARVELPASKLKIEIARVLKEEGYISTYKVVDESKTRKAAARLPEIHAGQALGDHRSAARLAPRQPPLSWPSTRFAGCVGGLGINILSTPRGVMTGRAARKERVGGEVLCEVW